jgi:hypothetical protein
MTSPPYPTAGQFAIQPRPRTWFQKNWKWFVPMVVVVVLFVLATLIGAVLYGIQSMFRASYPYQVAVHRATESPAVADTLGTPLHVGWFTLGNVNFSGSEGSANFSIPISGPKGHGRIIVVGKKHADRWTFETFEVDVAGQAEPIPLLEATPASPAGNGNDNST